MDSDPVSPPSSDLTGIDPSTQEYVRSLWIAEDYDSYFAFNPLFRFDAEFLERLFPAPLTMVDLGCGTGRHLVPFARRGFEVTGVDISEQMLRILADKLDEEKLQAQLLRSNLCRIPDLEGDSFEAAICMFSTLGMIRGSENRLACAREACRLLRPGGLFVVHCHNFVYQGHLPETWIAWGRSLTLSLLHGYELGDKVLPEYRSINNMYLHLFRPSELQRLLNRAGFQVVRVAYLNARRDRELGPVFFKSLRANGFIAVARKRERQ